MHKIRILGIDPGLKATGYGLIEFAKGLQSSLTLLEAGTIEPKARDPLEKKLLKVYVNLDAIIKQYNPHVLVLEKLYSHGQRPTIANTMGHVRGVICLLCAQEKIELIEYSVKRIRKALIGNGNATKVQVQSAIARMLRIKEDSLTHDASDALALALGYSLMQRVLD